MIRRNTRLRKEFLYRKSLEGKEEAAYERKRQLRKALDGEQQQQQQQQQQQHISSGTPACAADSWGD
jgi:hypothetical protein